MTVTYFSENPWTSKLVTDESLITVKGISVPAGTYSISPALDFGNSWTLRMKRTTGKHKYSALPPVPMALKILATPVRRFALSFDQTGGSCTLRWVPENFDGLLSVEFTEKNSDLRVIDGFRH